MPGPQPRERRPEDRHPSDHDRKGVSPSAHDLWRTGERQREAEREEKGGGERQEGPRRAPERWPIYLFGSPDPEAGLLDGLFDLLYSQAGPVLCVEPPRGEVDDSPMYAV